MENLELILIALSFLTLLLLLWVNLKRGRQDEILRGAFERSSAQVRSDVQVFVANQVQLLRDEFRLFRLDQTALQEGLQKQVQERLDRIQQQSELRLEQLRTTVDQRLQVSLEQRLDQRLGESFKRVGDQLEQVQRGLGEMQVLAADVGGLKRVLSNVKVRGVLGEAQLGALLEQFLAPGQYGVNVRVKPRSQEQVEFAIKMPGAVTGEWVHLPIDSKFPLEDYQRLNAALEAGDPQMAAQARKALEQRVLGQARDIRDKYICPPATTDFAILFLPFEGLFAEVLRVPGLLERLQREYRVTLTGPTTLVAFLNSLQMGFRTLAISRRSGEVWKLLSSVKADFTRFGDAIEALDHKLDEAKSRLGSLSERRRILDQRLSKVQSLEVDTNNAQE